MMALSVWNQFGIRVAPEWHWHQSGIKVAFLQLFHQLRVDMDCIPTESCATMYHMCLSNTNSTIPSVLEKLLEFQGTKMHFYMGRDHSCKGLRTV